MLNSNVNVFFFFFLNNVSLLAVSTWKWFKFHSSRVDVYRFQIADPVSDHAAANVFMTTFGEHSLLTSRRVHYRQFLITLVFVCRWKNHGKATHIGPIPISSSAIKSIRGNENENRLIGLWHFQKEDLNEDPWLLLICWINSTSSAAVSTADYFL